MNIILRLVLAVLLVTQAACEKQQRSAPDYELVIDLRQRAVEYQLLRLAKIPMKNPVLRQFRQQYLGPVNTNLIFAAGGHFCAQRGERSAV